MRRRVGPSSDRVSAKPAIVASSHGTTMWVGGTPSTDSATSFGDPLAASATTARGAGESFGRRADETVRRHLQIAYAALHDVAMRCPGADDDRARRAGRDLPQQLLRRVVLPFAALRRLREHDDRASERGGDVGR